MSQNLDVHSSASPRETNDAAVLALAQGLERYCTLIKVGGVAVNPWTPKALATFATYPPELQTRILEGVRKSCSALEDLAVNGIPYRDTKLALWRVFNHFGFVPKSDLIPSISDRSVVEIYLPTHTQWFRSQNYFQYTSYSMGELVCFPWTELVEHEVDHSKLFMDIAQGIFENRVTTTEFLSIPPSISRERFSEKRYRARLDAKILSPLVGRESGVNEGLAVVWQIDLLGEQSRQIPYGLQVELPPNL
jgi:hypothetical protein